MPWCHAWRGFRKCCPRVRANAACASMSCVLTITATSTSAPVAISWASRKPDSDLAGVATDVPVTAVHSHVIRTQRNDIVELSKYNVTNRVCNGSTSVSKNQFRLAFPNLGG